MMYIGSKPSEPWRLRIGLLVLATIILVLDQLSKQYFQNWLSPYERQEVFAFFSWVLVYNKGAAFSLLSDGVIWQRWLLSAITMLVSLWLIAMIMQAKAGERLEAYGYAFILGGALGNLWDRLTAGQVTDFILVHYEDWYFPAFNIADCAITFGVLCWLLAILIYQPRALA